MTPSGEQHELAFAQWRACAVEVGGGLRTLSLGERELLFGYGRDELCGSGRGQVLAPWPNRIAEGRYSFDGRELQLPLNEPERRTAIHGLVRWSAWSVAERDEQAVSLEHHLHPQPGYPFALHLTVRYALGPEGLEVTAAAENTGDVACPFALGFHPYLAGPVDELVLSVPASTALVTDDQGVEERREPCDLEEPRRIGARKLDATVTDLQRDADGLARVRAGDLELWCDEAFPFLQVFSGDLPDIRRRGLAVEPMTSAPNAFRSGDGLLRLEPGARFTGRFGIGVTMS